MANSGKELESLVKNIESALLPLGFKITSRDKIFDDGGNQIAEFDIFISGKLGTTEINWLIECRDRPSKGAAPVSWIEQLVGRRDRFNFNKITAVSTTGFSKSAMDYANKAGIEIRSVKQLLPEDILSWAKLSSATISETFGEMKNVQFFINNASEKQELQIASLLKSISNDDEIFVSTATGKKFSLNDIWVEAMNTCGNKLTENIPPGSEPKRKTLDVNYPNLESRYKFVLDGKDILIERIIFTFLLLNYATKRHLRKALEEH